MILKNVSKMDKDELFITERNLIDDIKENCKFKKDFTYFSDKYYRLRKVIVKLSENKEEDTIMVLTDKITKLNDEIAEYNKILRDNKLIKDPNDVYKKGDRFE